MSLWQLNMYGKQIWFEFSFQKIK